LRDKRRQDDGSHEPGTQARKAGGGANSPTARACIGTTGNGTPCQATPQSGSSFCFLHDPNKTEEQRRARQAGGSTRAAKVLDAETPAKVIQSVADVKGLLSETIHQVRTGAIDPKIGNCIGYLSGILLKAIEVGDIEERLAAMEAVVGRSPRTGLAGDFDRPLPGEDGDHEGDSDDIKEDAA
jgi:hypothetical protein